MVAVARRTPNQSAVKPVHSDLPEVEDLARQVAELQRVPNPFAQGVEVEFTFTGAVPQSAEHKLGRVPRGWILTRLVAASSAHVSERVADSTSLTLFASAACTAKVWVY
jgi:hypothetical protein